eukprot:10779266-Alexandrium_andersonii.AAC.1
MGGGELGPGLGGLHSWPGPATGVQRRPPRAARLVLGPVPGGPAPGIPPLEAQGARLPVGQ